MQFREPKRKKMTVTVMDEDVVTDDTVGTGSFDLTKVLSDPREHKGKCFI